MRYSSFCPTPQPRLSWREIIPLTIFLTVVTQTANAQSTSATQPPSVAGFFSQLFGTVAALATIALVVGYFQPNAFRFLFKDKATKGVICGTFAVVMFLFAAMSSSLEPKPIVTPQEQAAVEAQRRAENSEREAKRRAEAAEDRAAKAEKAAAVAKVAEAKAADAKARAEARMTNKSEDLKSSAASHDVNQENASQAVPVAKSSEEESLPRNVGVNTFPGIGKRQVGEVDKVRYAVFHLETAPGIGNINADGVFYILRVAAFNKDKQTHNVTTSIMKLIDDQDREYTPSREGGMALIANGDNSAAVSSAQVQPGVVKQFTLVYDAPYDESGLRLKIPAGTFSLNPDVTIKVPKENQ